MAVEFRKIIPGCALPVDDLAEWERQLLMVPAEPVPEWELSIRRGGPEQCQYLAPLLADLRRNSLRALGDAFTGGYGLEHTCGPGISWGCDVPGCDGSGD